MDVLSSSPQPFAIRLLASRRTYRLVAISIGALFIWAGALKLSDPRAFAAVISRYGLVPDELLIVTALGLPVLEVVAGLGAIMNRRGAIPLLFGLLLLFIAVLWFAILSGLEVDCGCFSLSEQKEHAGLRTAFARDWLLLLGVVYLGVWQRLFGHKPALPFFKEEQ